MRRWRLSRGDVVLYVALVSVILPAGTFLTRHLTPPGVSAWFNVVMALVGGGLMCRYFGFLIPAKLTYGGPGNRVMFGWLLPYLCAQWSFDMWYPGFKFYLGPGAAAGFTAATAFRLVRRWQAMRATSKEERDASLPPEPVYSKVSLVTSIIYDFGGSVAFATFALIIGAQLTTALKPVLERAVAPLPGGHLAVAGHLVVAYVAVSLCGLVFTFAVTSRFLRSITIGMRDFEEMPRAGQYFWACLPYVIALGWSVRQSGLAFGCASTLLLLIALGIWTDSPPEVAFSKAKATTVLWRSRLRQRLWSRSRTEPA